MSQEQPRRAQGDEPIKYGDLFDVHGELASKPVAPMDAAMMQSAENAMLGKTPKGGAAAVMQSAAMRNERAGHVRHKDMTGAAADLGVVEQYNKKVTTQTQTETATPPALTRQEGGIGGITIGEALEATAVTAGKKPVEWSDAAAIQAAEVRATGRTNIVPGGVAAAAQSAATLNARFTRDEDKTKLADILADASSKLPADKVATRKDAEGVTGAEMRNSPNLAIHPAGVSVSVTAAARLNQIHN
ncbi:late embryogenesis abundant protein D-34-like [Senna tora]|uniref:Late embryogenesis abundant protein D-34-like n=1 Tax=Senna tora TaxID=362788 RepID=A0A834WC33_9FABA|nr:late embryogenesis abundant protein D-34-like [Senna tora]